MKLSFFKSKPKKQGDRSRITKRLTYIKAGEKNEEVTEDVRHLVKGLADGDG